MKPTSPSPTGLRLPPPRDDRVCGSLSTRGPGDRRVSFPSARSVRLRGADSPGSHTNAFDRYCFITINHAATIGPGGPRPRPPGAAAGGGVPGTGAGAGPRSGWKRYTLCVLVSTQIVFAPANVATVSTTMYLSGESWCTTVTLPSPPFGM